MQDSNTNTNPADRLVFVIDSGSDSAEGFDYNFCEYLQFLKLSYILYVLVSTCKVGMSCIKEW